MAARKKKRVKKRPSQAAPQKQLPGKTSKSHRKNTKAEKAEQKAKYLMKFAETGRNDLASKYAGCGVQHYWFWKRDDPEFAKALVEARTISVKMMEDHAIKRGTTGTRKPIYQRGQLVGFERLYSDSLLTFMLKGLAPETYRERISVTGKDDGPIKHGLTKETANFIRAEVLGVKPKKK